MLTTSFAFRFSGQKAFSRVEAMFLCCTLVVAAAVLAVLLGAPGLRRQSVRAKDSEQIRGIHQALVLSYQGGNDEYALPSRADRSNLTVADVGEAKNTTANIFSMLVYWGSIGPEMLVSPAEVNPRIRVYDKYEFDEPSGAVDPLRAAWDPKLRADFTSAEGGNVSYAHTPYQGTRRGKWNNSFNANDAILSNRGPEIASVTYGADGVASAGEVLPSSLTFLIHGSRKWWEGHVAFNDNRVEFLTAPKVGRYKPAAGSEREDVLFYDEPDDPNAGNHFHGIFIRAGREREDFRAIWD